jgi:ATP-binding cassette subfamily C (CFTR/MRP) protein 1
MSEHWSIPDPSNNLRCLFDCGKKKWGTIIHCERFHFPISHIPTERSFVKHVPSNATTLNDPSLFRKINKFLLEEDRTNMRIISQLEDTRPKSSQVLIETDASTTLELNSGLSGTAVMKLENATFGTKEGGLPTIRSLDLNFNRSSLTMIVGKVGSGKSTLLKGLISEIPLTSGSMQRCFAEAGFCEQQAWLVNDTIQNNILGQSNLEARWYDTVVKSCALYKDFALLQLGDLSVIGSKGISLSGGQKQRLVSLNLNAKIIY